MFVNGRVTLCVGGSICVNCVCVNYVVFACVCDCVPACVCAGVSVRVCLHACAPEGVHVCLLSVCL